MRVLGASGWLWRTPPLDNLGTYFEVCAESAFSFDKDKGMYRVRCCLAHCCLGVFTLMEVRNGAASASESRHRVERKFNQRTVECFCDAYNKCVATGSRSVAQARPRSSAGTGHGSQSGSSETAAAPPQGPVTGVARENRSLSGIGRLMALDKCWEQFINFFLSLSERAIHIPPAGTTSTVQKPPVEVSLDAPFLLEGPPPMTRPLVAAPCPSRGGGTDSTQHDNGYMAGTGATASSSASGNSAGPESNGALPVLNVPGKLR